MKTSLDDKKKFYTELINSTYDKLLVYARMRITDSSEAHDLVQDACCTAWENIDRVMGSANPGGWLMNTLKNHIHKYYDAQASDKRIMDSLTAERRDDTYLPDFEEEIAFTSALSQEEVRIIKLKEQGYKHREIAKMLKERPSTIDSKVSRIKSKVEKFLKNEKK